MKTTATHDRPTLPLGDALLLPLNGAHERNRKPLRPSFSVDLTTFCRCTTDPLVHHGRHFGRTVHALCSVPTLLLNGILRSGERADDPEECFTPESVFNIRVIFTMNSLITFVFRELREHRVYDTLLKMIPNLEERLMNASEEEVAMIAELAGVEELFDPTCTDNGSSYKRGLRVPGPTIRRASRV